MMEKTEDDSFEGENGKSKIEYQKLKLKLNELQKKKMKYTLFMGIFAMIVASMSFCDLLRERHRYIIAASNVASDVAYSIVFGGLLGLCVAFYVYMILDMRESRFRRKMLEYEVEDIQEEVQDNVFENSLKMSYKYLDQYYLQTREQAQKGFFVTVCVSIFGAVLIGIGIVAMFLEKTNPSYVTCASGVITEFIAAIFFYLYNKTVTSMSKYHNKLVLSQNISIALKIADTLPDNDKVKSKDIIISELLKDINTYLIKNDSDDKN